MPEFPLPEPPLADEQVALRPWREEDVPAVTAGCQDREVPRWTTIPSPYTEHDAREFISRSEPDRRSGRELNLAIVEVADESALLGGCGLSRIDWEDAKAEIGYWVAPGARGRSVGTRAVSLLSRWTLAATRIERIELLVDPQNERSLRLALSAGYTREGLLRGFRRRGGGRWDLVMHSLLREDA